MTAGLWMLFWAIGLAFVQMLIAVQGATFQVGLATLAGNRDAMEPMPDWKGRAERAYRNMLEYLPLFAILILIEHAAGTANSLSIFGAQLFVGARVVYAAVYLAGIPWLRTAIWAVSIVGLVLIAWPIASV